MIHALHVIAHQYVYLALEAFWLWVQNVRQLVLQEPTIIMDFALVREFYFENKLTLNSMLYFE